MKTIAVIAELNPAHNGHAWLFENARRLSGADRLVVLMSGDFVQRGEPAIYDKYIRTQMALLLGADLVLELPVASATGSARRFAEGACSLLDKLGCIDELWFGSECGNIDLFLKLSGILAEEPDDYRRLLQKNLSSGIPFAAAREAALREYINGASEDELSLLRSPNNILGLEYCLALRRLSSDIRPYTIPRQGSVHTDTALSPDGFSSASSIRRMLLSQSGIDASSSILTNVPEVLHPLYQKLCTAEPAVSANDFSDMLCYALWHTESDTYTQYLDVSEELGNRIEQLLPRFDTFESFADLLKTKDRSLSYIRRALLHILLDIRSLPTFDPSTASSVRMLGRSSRADCLFTSCKEKGRLTLFSGGAALNDPLYAADLFSSHLYESVHARISGSAFQSEFSRFVLTPELR